MRLSELMAKLRIEKINTSRTARHNGDTPFISWSASPINVGDTLVKDWSVSEASVLSIYLAGETLAVSLLDQLASCVISKDVYLVRVANLKSYRALVKRTCVSLGIIVDMPLYSTYLGDHVAQMAEIDSDDVVQEAIKLYEKGKTGNKKKRMGRKDSAVKVEVDDTEETPVFSLMPDRSEEEKVLGAV